VNVDGSLTVHVVLLSPAPALIAHVHNVLLLLLQQESGGTVLSTNWKDIGEEKTECKPPDGMELKKWEF